MRQQQTAAAGGSSSELQTPGPHARDGSTGNSTGSSGPPASGAPGRRGQAAQPHAAEKARQQQHRNRTHAPGRTAATHLRQRLRDVALTLDELKLVAGGVFNKGDVRLAALWAIERKEGEFGGRVGMERGCRGSFKKAMSVLAPWLWWGRRCTW